MGNIDNRKIMRIYGVTLAEKQTRPYGHGLDKLKIDGEEVLVQYVDYFIEDLIALIKNQKKERRFREEFGWKRNEKM